MQPAGFVLNGASLPQEAKTSGSTWNVRRRPSLPETVTPDDGSKSELSKAEEKHELAMKYVNAGDYARGWELLEELGDREGARRLLQEAYNASKQQTATAVDSAAEARSRPPRLPTLLPGGRDVRPSKQQTGIQLSTPSRPGSASEARRPEPTSEAKTPEAVQVPEGTKAPLADSPALAKEAEEFTAGLRRTLGINRRRLSRIEEVFKEWDRDNSGAISREEFLYALQRLRSYVTADEANAMFTHADSDGDGYLVREEFGKWLGGH